MAKDDTCTPYGYSKGRKRAEWAELASTLLKWVVEGKHMVFYMYSVA